MTAPVDWSRWRKCPVCAAEIGDACTKLTGMTRGGVRVRIAEPRPHKTRKPRTGGKP